MITTGPLQSEAMPSRREHSNTKRTQPRSLQHFLWLIAGLAIFFHLVRQAGLPQTSRFLWLDNLLVICRLALTAMVCGATIRDIFAFYFSSPILSVQVRCQGGTFSVWPTLVFHHLFRGVLVGILIFAGDRLSVNVHIWMLAILLVWLGKSRTSSAPLWRYRLSVIGMSVLFVGLLISILYPKGLVVAYAERFGHGIVMGTRDMFQDYPDYPVQVHPPWIGLIFTMVACGSTLVALCQFHRSGKYRWRWFAAWSIGLLGMVGFWIWHQYYGSLVLGPFIHEAIGWGINLEPDVWWHQLSGERLLDLGLIMMVGVLGLRSLGRQKVHVCFTHPMSHRFRDGRFYRSLVLTAWLALGLLHFVRLYGDALYHDEIEESLKLFIVAAMWAFSFASLPGWKSRWFLKRWEVLPQQVDMPRFRPGGVLLSATMLLATGVVTYYSLLWIVVYSNYLF